MKIKKYNELKSADYTYQELKDEYPEICNNLNAISKSINKAYKADINKVKELIIKMIKDIK